MIRLGALYLLVLAIAVTSIRHWFVALCGLVLLAVFTQHPSMPGNMLGIQGLNPWNILLALITLSWWVNRKGKDTHVRFSRSAALLSGAFVGLIVVTGIVAAMDVESFRGDYAGRLTSSNVIVNTIINPLKYLWVGFLFFEGARDRAAARLAVFTAVGSGILYALMLFKSMKLAVFTMGFDDARRLTDKLVGLFANDLAELFAFVLWGGALLIVLWERLPARMIWAAILAAVLPPFVALKSRAGFAAFCAVGLVLGALRWRWFLLAVPLTAAAAIVVAPGIRERALMGVDVAGSEHSWDEISAGRLTNIWPPAFEQFTKSPLYGYGRYAILRTDCFDEILSREKLVPSHPHSSYLEVLIDAGIIGLASCLACAVGMFVAGVRLLRTADDRFVNVLGGLAIGALVAELTAGLTGSSFFPSQSSLPYLSVWGVALRCYMAMPAREFARNPRALRQSRRWPSPLREVLTRP